MASVSSLDKDLRKMRLDKYTPAAANEAKNWIEETLGERLQSGDLLEALKDGVALCKLVNLVISPPGLRFKQSTMPFVQMENISHFLRACQSPPFNLHEHDVFLTVDLFEQKDPAQVLQCLGAFSRAANAVNSSRVPNVIGPKSASQPSGGPSTPIARRARGTSITSNTSSAYTAPRSLYGNASAAGESSLSGRWSPSKGHVKSPSSVEPPSSPSHVSSWSKREQEGATAPAWNIAQYGYMGGASQGNLGIQFGGRRQIIGDAPQVPSLAEKERVRKEQELEAVEQERHKRAEEQAEEERAREAEQRLWEEQTNQLRQQEQQKVEQERIRWEEEERQWRLTEEKRRKDEQEEEAKLEEERRRARSRSPVKLRGQFLSQYQAERGISGDATTDDSSSRIKALEKELELARQREAEYERERQGRAGSVPVSNVTPTTIDPAAVRVRSRSRPRAAGLTSPPVRQESWTKGEREILHTRGSPQPPRTSRFADAPQPIVELTPEPEPQPEPVKAAAAPPPISPRPLPEPTFSPLSVKSHNTGGSTRPLPDPATYTSPPTPKNRTDRFLATNPAPVQQSPTPTYSRELGGTAEHDGEDRRRIQSQTQTKAGGWASKSLLEREMDQERERQREWEEAQKETAKAVRPANGVDGIGGGVGGRWDVGQWSGYTGGDSQNNGNQGIGAGRRQIVGPRPLPGSNR